MRTTHMSFGSWQYQMAALYLVLLAAVNVFPQADIITSKSPGLAKIPASAQNKITQLRESGRYKRVDIIEVDYTRLKDANVKVTLPDGTKHVFARRKSASARSAGSHRWVGMLQGDHYGTTTFISTPDGTRMVGTIHIMKPGAERTLQISTLEDGTKVLMELDPKKYNFQCGTGQLTTGRDE